MASGYGNRQSGWRQVTARSSKLTYEDYVLFPDDGKRHEIIDGDHYETPAPKTKHQRVSFTNEFISNFTFSRTGTWSPRDSTSKGAQKAGVDPFDKLRVMVSKVEP